ncbi:GLPGLI family protein [Mucilaginibacter pallidiroseus]|uniref:GLPGLI family protein n=1 Tax=Mucilaginibacter pallidiroseus TaxID=2599295 RepID=A0A563TWV5_9SPHI|nr:GLPGLI family protein [Mucilaginibacter pallidiroseus]TWR23835.1 GLPGLI family protein [Mucilaginibacter pallidiroseus]
MKKYILLLLVCAITNSLFAQNKHFTTSGTIEFEKRVNMYAIIKKMIDEEKDNESWYGPAFEAYKKNNPQFKSLKSTLTFTNNKTYYTPVVAEAAPSNGWFSDMPQAQQINTVYTDLNTSAYTANKKVFDEQFLVKDTTRKINWKITDETREIAGYTCRRANALVMDSIYVVAFYTDEIAVSGGPEFFTGLPGMILGVAIPHENITWFATKVTDTPIAETTLKTPAKGKAVNTASLTTTLKSVMKNWGEYGKKFFRMYLL